MTKPEPGQVWERDGERREVIDSMFGVWYVNLYKIRCWCSAIAWESWQSGAKLVERKEPTQ